MRDIEHASVFWGIYFSLYAFYTLSRLCEVYFAKHVIQASTASSHRVGKCIFEPSKQSRIRRSCFWSRRRSTVQWETALSSKERSRRVNCPMLVPFVYHCMTHIIRCIQEKDALRYIFTKSNMWCFTHIQNIPSKYTKHTHTSLVRCSFNWIHSTICFYMWFFSLRQWQAVTVEFKIWCLAWYCRHLWRCIIRWQLSQLECGESKQFRTFDVISVALNIWTSSGGQVWCQQPR